MRPGSRSGFELRRLVSHSDELQRLLSQSDEYMGSLYPPESNHLESVSDLLAADALMLGAFDNGRMVGCGAVKILEDDSRYGEIKRVFLLDSHRGLGISKAIMQSLENYLISSQVFLVRLETGIKQSAAIGLYHSLGYLTRQPFGRYRPDPLSLFMEKRLIA